MPLSNDPTFTGSRAVSATIAGAAVPFLIPVSGEPGTGAVYNRPTPYTLIPVTTVATTSPILDRGGVRGPAALVIANVGTGSPSMTVNITGSVDGVNFYNIGYALVATPNTVAVAAITITTTATTTYLLVTDQAWRYLQVAVTAVTTETYSVTYYQ